MTNLALDLDLSIDQDFFRGPTVGEIFQKDKIPKLSDKQIDDRLVESEDRDDVWNSVKAQLLKLSPAFFAQEILRGPPEAPYFGKFLIGPHHEEWDQLVVENKRVCVLAPRDHGKTFFFDFAYPIFMSVVYPGRAGFIFSATQDQAIRILDDIKEEFETNPKLQHLVPPRKAGERWSSTSIRLTNGSRIYARGFGTRVRGAHPYWIIVDDGLNDETAYSETVRRKQNDYFYNAVSNMVTPNGVILVVGTPFHQQDLYGDLQENQEYVFKQYQALNGASERPLWPERYSYDRLMSKRREIGSIRFTREFQCESISDDMSLFPLQLFQQHPQEQRTLKLGMPLEFWHQLGVTPYMGVDFALSSSVQADYTVIWVMGLDNFGNRWVIDIFRERGMPYQSQLSKMNELGRKYEPALLFVESNQAQRIFGDELIRTTDLPIQKYQTGAEKNCLERGVPSLRVLLENCKFRIPRGDRESVEMTSTWINEMRSMTFVEGKITTIAEHDDLVMACWLCDQAIRRGGFSFAFGQDDDVSGNIDDVISEVCAEPNAQLEVEQSDGGNGSSSGNLVDDGDAATYGGLSLDAVLRHHGIY
jgi:hypothetical protein